MAKTLMGSAIPAQPPTITMRWIKLDDGIYGVELLVSGLKSQRQAEAAMAHMQRLFGGAEINGK